MKKDTIGIIGQGFVGSAVYEGLKEHYHIQTYDINLECTQPDLRSLYWTTGEIIFLCLPTPMNKDGSCHLKIIEDVLDEGFLDLADYVNAFQQKMEMGREVIADRGIWTAKKRYILNVHDNEGVRLKEPKLKLMGIETAKSSPTLR